MDDFTLGLILEAVFYGAERANKFYSFYKNLREAVGGLYDELLKEKDADKALRVLLSIAFTSSLLKIADEFSLSKEGLELFKNEVLFKDLTLASFEVEDLVKANSAVSKEIETILGEKLEKELVISFRDFLRRVREELIIEFWAQFKANEKKLQVLKEKLESKEYEEKRRWFRIAQYLAEVVKTFESEPIFGNNFGITLADIYVEPEFRVYFKSVGDKEKFKEDNEFFWLQRERGIFLLPANEKERELYSLTYRFFRGEELKGYKPENPRVLLLLGYPGEGKSSFCRRCVVDFVANRIGLDRELYYLELKRLKKIPRETFETDGLIEFLKSELKRLIKVDELRDFENSVLILDGLDELKITEGFREGEKFLETLLSELSRLYSNLKILITSRYGYVDLKKVLERYGDLALAVELRGFTKEKAKSWIEKYSRFDADAEKFIESVEQVWSAPEKYKSARELITQPVLLYMIVSSGIDIVSLRTKAALYEELLNFVVSRKWQGKHENLRGVDAESLAEILQELAFLMFKKGELYLLKEEVLQAKAVREFMRTLGVKPEEVLKGLLIAFYFREFEEDEHYAVEFYHKSIQEYFTARYFVSEFRKLLESKNVEEIKERVWELFSHRAITEEIREFIEEIAPFEKVEESEEFFKAFEELLKSHFLVKPQDLKGEERPLRRPLLAFRNFWLVLKAFFPEDSVLSKISRLGREFFAEMLKLSQSYDETCVFFEFPLTFENLSGLNLKGVNLSRANLRKIKLSDGNLEAANFYGANLEKADFEEANLLLAILRLTDLREANFLRANLLGADLQGAKLIAANLKEAYSTGADFGGADLRRANFENAELLGTSFRKADLRGAYLRGADLWQVDFTGANLRGAFFEWREIQYAENWESAINNKDNKRN